MKRFTLTIFLIVVSLSLFAQEKQAWMDARLRELKYPSNMYFTGFVYRVVEKSVTEETQIAKQEAQTELIKKIRAQITAKTQNKIEAVSSNGKYSETESFSNQANIESSAEIVGMKFESYHDAKEKMVYAFAYVNKNELIDFYKGNLSLNINQIESFVKTAQDLETQKEKAKARQQLENTIPFFQKVRYAQDLLIAMDAKTSAEDLQQTKSESLYNQLTQMQARLAQGVYVYVESSEDMLGKKVDIVANKLKAELAKKGCSFIDKAEEADFTLRLKVSTRPGDESHGIVFCWVDTEVELFDHHKQKVVYGDNISDKDGSNTLEKAARKVMEKTVTKIAEKLKDWIQ